VLPLTVIQTSVVHLIRHSLKAIYRAKNAEAGLKALVEFETSFWGQRYPAIAQSWQRNREHVVPFLAYPESMRRIVYTTDEIDKSFLLRFSPAIDAKSDAQLSNTGRARTNPLHSQTPAQPRSQPPRCLGHSSHSAHSSAASFNPASMRSRSHSLLNRYTAPRRPHRTLKIHIRGERLN
jgi:hypothetical protein